MFGTSQNYRLAVRQVFSLVGLLALLLWSAGCGASRQEAKPDDESVSIDKLLGDEDISTQNRNADEAEVLSLLGISPAETKSQPQMAAAVQPVASEDSEAELNQLRDDLMKKDQEISELRAQLTQKQVQISDLEATKNSSPAKFVPPAGAPAEPTHEFKLAYEKGLRQFKARDYDSALATFQSLMQGDPGTTLSDNCQYWIGECYYARGDYNQAISEFERVFSFENSNKSDDAQLKLGLCYLKLGDKSQARVEFQRLLSEFPNSEYRGLASRYEARL